MARTPRRTRTRTMPLSPLAEDAGGLGAPPPDPVELIHELLVQVYSKEVPNLSDAEVARRAELGLRVLGLKAQDLDPINRRGHYNQSKFEVIEIIDDHSLDFYRGNVVKYLLRAPFSGNVLEQFEKAKYYLDRLVRLTKHHGGPFGYQALQQSTETPGSDQ
jgi:hypothetical protein